MYDSYMIMRAFGKFAVVFILFILGLFLFGVMCSGKTCGNAIFSVLSEVTDNNEANIQINEPAKNDTVQSPFVVRGNARVFDGTVSYELKDALGNLLSSGNIKTQWSNTKEFLPFTGSISFIGPGAPAGKLTLFDVSPKDGSKLDIITIQLALIYNP